MKKLIVLAAIAALAACTTEPVRYEEPPEPMGRPYPRPSPNERPYVPRPHAAPAAAPTVPIEERPYEPPPVSSAGPLKPVQVSSYMDNQENELRARMRPFGIRVARRGDDMVLTILDSRMFGEGGGLSSEGKHLLQSLALIARHFDRTAIVVDSYTDTVGSPDKNLDISKRRANAVVGALADYGVPRARLKANGFGEEDLRIKTGPNVNEPRNRRVEIHILPTPAG